MSQKILSRGKLLNGYGHLNEAGYAFSLVKDYNKADIKASKLRIKEWDYYFVGNESFGIALTVADNGYMGLGSITLLDFEKKTYRSKNLLKLFPMGKLNMPKTSGVGQVSLANKKCSISFTNNGQKRLLTVTYKNFDKKFDLNCSIELFDEPKDSMCIVIPFDKKYHFYYNQKINCLRAKGKITLGSRVYTFNPSESFGVLDFGRGVWTYNNTWYWASMSGMFNNKTIGFNLGYGFGNTQDASENMIFLDGKGYKIEEVTFKIPKKDNDKENYLNEWLITSSDKSLELYFTPVLNRKSSMNILILKSIQNQVFGHYNGYVIVDGEKVEIKNMFGFAEKVKNLW